MMIRYLIIFYIGVISSLSLTSLSNLKLKNKAFYLFILSFVSIIVECLGDLFLIDNQTRYNICYAYLIIILIYIKFSYNYGTLRIIFLVFVPVSFMLVLNI
jgi:hypothetical protein